MPDFFAPFDDDNLEFDIEDGADSAALGNEEHARHPLDWTGVASGDRSTFTPEQRLAIRGLLHGPFISGAQDKDMYHEVLRSVGAFRAFLGNLMVELVIDEVGEIAYLRDWELLPEGAPSLFRRSPLTHIQTAIVLNLRKKLAHTISGERTIVDANHVFEETLPYQQNRGTDRSKQRTDFDSAWKSLTSRGVVKSTPLAGRWEVSPVLASVFSAEEIAAVHQSYSEMLEQMTPMDTTVVDELMESDDE
ncbi:hypothetical protein COCCU_06245 [Corynebacterium occultum]|uniref:DUF4194 domain-containing protein n=1 Tax=Corynebacterium occultum TaxID=2675219 RepID=A0A6B8W3U4_9CORY|nr:DUF4194 domain-containing protein [Corynebacterium occultum]QGU07191.1 hypothetical protein COCCU_06245 [Corynebacterium occultum]